MKQLRSLLRKTQVMAENTQVLNGKENTMDKEKRVSKDGEHPIYDRSMKEVVVHPYPELHTTISDVSIPTPKDDELLIKVAIVASNVKDWAHLTARKVSMNSGDDVAGTVVTMGKTVAETGEFKEGDRVAGFHPMFGPGGGYAEYALVPYHTAFIIPEKTTFEEAATIPLVTLTAGLSLFRRQKGLPTPWSPRDDHSAPIPLIVYGAASALGNFAIKLAKAANIHPIIAIAGSTTFNLNGLLDEDLGDTLIDYRQGIEGMKTDVKNALGKLKAEHAIDCITSNGTWIPISQMLDPENGQLSVVSGANTYDEPEIPEGVQIKYTYVGTVHTGAYLPHMPKQPEEGTNTHADMDFAYVLMRFIARMMGRDEFEGHPTELIQGGLEGVEKGLRKLKAGEAKGVKFIYRVYDTPGVHKD